MNFIGKVAIVTGASGGIGEGIARRLAGVGAAVLITHLPNDADDAAARAVAASIQSSAGTALTHALELPDPTAASACAKRCKRDLGGIDILVNNAGVMQKSAGLDTTLDDFAACHAVNLTALWTMTQACLPMLKDAGEGRIVNVSSGAGRRGSANLPAYSASKAAAISLTQSLAEALAPHNITVNAVCPGVILTAMSRSFAGIVAFPGRKAEDDTEAMIEWSEQVAPLGRMQTVDDVAYAVSFFASAEARNITGQALNVDGGMTMN